MGPSQRRLAWGDGRGGRRLASSSLTPAATAPRDSPDQLFLAGWTTKGLHAPSPQRITTGPPRRCLGWGAAAGCRTAALSPAPAATAPRDSAGADFFWNTAPDSNKRRRRARRPQRRERGE